MPNQYSFKMVAFAPDGDFITDFRNCSTAKECVEQIENMGSRWFFYPFCFVVNEVTEKVKYTCNHYTDHLVGQKIDVVKQHMKDNKEFFEGFCEY